MADKSDVSKYSFDASFSWNGYNYQGKVGLFIALKKIEELIEAGEDINEYFLELEYLEDFSIKKNDEYITIHQVKTYDSSAISKYKEAVWGLLGKLLKFDNIDKAYLHSTSSVELPDDFLTKQIIKDSNNQNDQNDQNNKKKPKIISPYDSYKAVVDSGKSSELLKRFDVYNYGDQGNKKCFCEFDDIEEKIKEMIKKFIDSCASPERIERAYLCLLGMVDFNIKERHKGIQNNAKDKVAINFDDIKKIVDKNYDVPSREYTIYYMRNEFQKISREYIKDIEAEIKEDSVSKGTIDNFKKNMEKIYHSTDDKFYEFCLKISPDINVTEKDENVKMDFCHRCLPRQGLESCFFQILQNINRKLEDNWFFHEKMINQENVVYLPSTILDDDKPNRKKKLMNRIFENDHLDLLREVDKIINKNITTDTIDDSRIYHNISETDIDSDVQESEHYHDRITKMKKISLIKISDAEAELE